MVNFVSGDRVVAIETRCEFERGDLGTCLQVGTVDVNILADIEFDNGNLLGPIDARWFKKVE